MNSIRLNNGAVIPQLGLGVYLTQDGEETVNSVKWALEAGYRHIDTAMIYGNEKSVAQGIKESGVPRKDIFITTKLWNEDIRQGRAQEAFKRSLEALDTDYVDLYLIHWPADGYEKAWEEMEKIYESGRAKAIGVSNFQVHHLETLMKNAHIKPAVNQIESHPYFTNQELIDYCLGQNIDIEVWSPLGGTGGNNVLSNDTIKSLAAKYRKTPAQIIIRWDIQRGVIVMPKSTHRDRILSNMQVSDWELSVEDMRMISELNRNERVGADPDNFDF